MPAFQTSLAVPLTTVGGWEPTPTLLFNAETPAANTASIAVAIQPPTLLNSVGRVVSFVFECPLGIGAGVFQIQESDGPDATNAASYVSCVFGGNVPGLVNSSSFITPGGTTAKVTRSE